MKKKICFVVARYGTALNFLKEPIRKLSSRYDVYLVADIKPEDDLSKLDLAGYKSIPIQRRPNLRCDVKALRELICYFKAMRFDSVHSITKKASLLTTIAGRLTGVPHRLHHFTGQMWSTMTGFRRWFYKYMDLFIAWSDTDLLVDGESQKEYLEEQGILKPGQATVLGKGSICGIDTKRFCRDEEVRISVRRELDLEEDKVVFISLGRLKREKGIYELLSAFNRITPSCENAVLLLVGADEEGCMERLSDYSNLQEGRNVIYYGVTKTPEHLYNAADVYVLPTYREGFGLSILEASATALPIITSDTYGVRDSIVENVTGVRCKTYDVETLAECIERLYSDKKLRERMGNEGVKYVNEFFTSEKISGEWFDYYVSVVV